MIHENTQQGEQAGRNGSLCRIAGTWCGWKSKDVVGQSPGWSAEVCGSRIKSLGMGSGLNAWRSALK